MRVLIDTTIRIDHLRSADVKLIALLRRDRVITHDHVIGELTMGAMKDGQLVLESLLDLLRAPLAELTGANGASKFSTILSSFILLRAHGAFRISC